MVDFLSKLQEYISKLKTVLIKFYYKALFIFNKHRTLQKIYEPLTENKIRANKELIKNLKQLKKKNTSLQRSIKKVKKENINLKRNILILQDILINKNS